MAYCPRCKSKLFPADETPMRLINVCSGCVSFNRQLQQQYAEAVANEQNNKSIKPKRNFNTKLKVK